LRRKDPKKGKERHVDTKTWSPKGDRDAYHADRSGGKKRKGV